MTARFQRGDRASCPPPSLHRRGEPCPRRPPRRNPAGVPMAARGSIRRPRPFRCGISPRPIYLRPPQRRRGPPPERPSAPPSPGKRCVPSPASAPPRYHAVLRPEASRLGGLALLAHRSERGDLVAGRRAPIDFRLKLRLVPVRFLSGGPGKARAEGNNAAWTCQCGDPVPLVGRCYYQFDDTCYTVCPNCGKKYRVTGQKSTAHGRRTTDVFEF